MDLSEINKNTGSNLRLSCKNGDKDKLNLIFKHIFDII